MALGKWFPCEHIGVRHMMWQEKIDDLNLPYFWVERNSWTQARNLEGNHVRVMISILRPRQRWTFGRQDGV